SILFAARAFAAAAVAFIAARALTVPVAAVAPLAVAAVAPLAAVAPIAVAVAALLAARRTLRRALGGLARLLPQQGLARQLDAVLVVDRDHLHLKDVADLAHILDAPDVLVVELADVAQPVAARQDLDEGAKLLHTRHLALVDLADLHLLG